MKNIVKLVGCSLLMAGLLSACGGGGGGSDSGTPPQQVSTVLTDAQIIADVTSSNIDYGPGANGRPAGTWRWSNTPTQHILVYIPAPTNPTEQTLSDQVNSAIVTYNTKLSTYFVLEPVSVAPTTTNFIQVSYNTAWVPPGSTDYNSYCANVSNVLGFSSDIVPDSQNSISDNPVYLNLGNGHCTVTEAITIHEFAHALGLGFHFDTFGSTTNPDNFWDVLATLYGNPQSTVAANLIVKRAN